MTCRRRRCGLAIAVVMLSLSSCAPKDDVQKAEAAVNQFHRDWNEWEFTKIYNEAHAGFRSAQSPDRTINALKNSRRVFGAFKSATKRSFNVRSEHVEKDIDFKYDCVYEYSAGVESFSFRMTGGKPLLLNYSLWSPEDAAKIDAAEEARKKR